MFISKLNSMREHLTPSEEKVADYILQHIEEIPKITSQQLAEASQTAQSTIIRFSKKLGYVSFRELLADLSAIPQKENAIEEISVTEDTATTLKKIVRQEQDIVELTIQTNSDKDLETVASLLAHAKSNLIFGVGSSSLFAEYLSNQLVKLGIPSQTTKSAHMIYTLIENADANSILFLVSESGETHEILKAAKLAKKKGMTVVAMTRQVANSLYAFSDYILKTVAFSTRTRLNVTTMRCSQLILIDILYLLIMKTDFERYNQLVAHCEALLH